MHMSYRSISDSSSQQSSYAFVVEGMYAPASIGNNTRCRAAHPIQLDSSAEGYVMWVLLLQQCSYVAGSGPFSGEGGAGRSVQFRGQRRARIKHTPTT